MYIDPTEVESEENKRYNRRMLYCENLSDEDWIAINFNI